MKKNGFSLVEIMIVVAIIGILATLGGSWMTSVNKKNAEKDAKIKIPTFLKGAIEDSFEKSEPRIITISTGSKKEILVKTTSGAVLYGTSLPGRLKYTVAPNSNFQLDSINGFNPSVTLEVKDENLKGVVRIVCRNITTTALMIPVVDVYMATTSGAWNVKKDKSGY